MRMPAALTAVVALSCARGAKPFPAPIPLVEAKPRTAYALQMIDLAPGAGAPAEAGKYFHVHYTGWTTDGKKFDSSRDTTAAGVPREPIAFPQGGRRVIAGWDTGFEGMKVGGRRRLIIPYQLAYGEKGRPPVIPPKATLVFDVELMAVGEAGPPTPGSSPPVPQCAPWAAVAPR